MNPLSGNLYHGRRLASAFVLYSAIILVAGLWPFNFLPENGISRPQDGNRLSFNGHGIMLSQEQESDPLLAFFSGKAITMELWVKPAAETASGIPSILAFYDRENRKNFFVGQWKSHLIVRTMTDHRTKDKRGYREIGLREALGAATEHFITITSDTNGTAIYLEGHAARTYGKYSVFCETCAVGQLVVGNSPMGKQGWSGELLGLAVYNRSLSPDEVFQSYLRWQEGSRESFWLNNTVALYVFPGGAFPTVRNHATPGLDLLVPETFVPPQRSILAWSWEYAQHRWSSIEDIVINIVGFIPFGLLAFALLARGGQLSGAFLLVFVALLGLALSLAIELVQAFLPSRDSSLIDVVCNAMGTTLGAAVCVWGRGQKTVPS
jgi:hypothetical protein